MTPHVDDFCGKSSIITSAPPRLDLVTCRYEQELALRERRVVFRAKRARIFLFQSSSFAKRLGSVVPFELRAEGVLVEADDRRLPGMIINGHNVEAQGTL